MSGHYAGASATDRRCDFKPKKQIDDGEAHLLTRKTRGRTLSRQSPSRSMRSGYNALENDYSFET
jgi:hypothetical protein